TLDTERRLSLARGALYLDSSHRTGPPETVEIVARGSVIRDVGTRYEVRLSDEELRVRVRDGRVEVQSVFGMREADRGGQLRVTPSANLARRALRQARVGLRRRRRSALRRRLELICWSHSAATARGPAATGIPRVGRA